jgi:AcrR family transcriptional regulator
MTSNLGPTRTRRSDATRQLIVGAAARAFAANGYEATSLDVVASEAGITKATIYYHFDSKEALYAAVVIPGIEAGTELVRRIAERSADAADALTRIVDAAIDASIRSAAGHPIFYTDAVNIGPAVRRSVREAQRRYEHAVSDVIRRGQGSGQVMEGDPEVLALLLIGAIARIQRWYDAGGRVPPDVFKGVAKRMLLDGLLATTNGEAHEGPMSDADERGNGRGPRA